MTTGTGRKSTTAMEPTVPAPLKIDVPIAELYDAIYLTCGPNVFSGGLVPEAIYAGLDEPTQNRVLSQVTASRRIRERQG